ncbi:MAG TPA: hypothetical protein VFY44_11145 [Thermoleophilaceae bacterium]|nr:hypothetical protein [Thermoleophilaceae bacterium]
MSTLTIVLIVVAVIVIALFVGGLVAARKRDREQAPAYGEHLREADQHLERARAADRGWDPALLETAAREALGRSHPGTEFDQLVLVLVDDQPGVHEDRAHYEAHAGEERVAVVLTRDEQGWRGQTAT